MKKLVVLIALMGTILVAHAQTPPDPDATELKAQIDTDITNKTGSGSITKTAVGNNMKAIVDYTTEFSQYVSDLLNASISTLQSTKANIASPSFTGTPTAPTPSSSDESFRIANTSWVTDKINSRTLQSMFIENGTITSPSSINFNTPTFSLSSPNGGIVNFGLNGGVQLFSVETLNIALQNQMPTDNTSIGGIIQTDSAGGGVSLQEVATDGVETGVSRLVLENPTYGTNINYSVPHPRVGDPSSLYYLITTINGAQANEFGEMNLSIPLEWSAQVSQTGTGAPIPQATAVNTIEGSSFGDPAYRELVWARTGVGTYTVKLYYTSGNLDVSKVAFYPPSNVNITGKNDGSDGGGAFRMYTFQTIDPFIVEVADGVLTGNNGGYFNIKIYP